MAREDSQFGRVGKSRIPSAVFALRSVEFPLTHAGSAMDRPVLKTIDSLCSEGMAS
jgi:hypothetical protein